jgi:hypothetical protein
MNSIINIKGTVAEVEKTKQKKKKENKENKEFYMILCMSVYF